LQRNPNSNSPRGFQKKKRRGRFLSSGGPIYFRTRKSVTMAALSAVAPVLNKTLVVSTGKVANTNSMMVWQPHGNKYVFRSVFLLRGVPRGGCSFRTRLFSSPRGARPIAPPRRARPEVHAARPPLSCIDDVSPFPPRTARRAGLETRHAVPIPGGTARDPGRGRRAYPRRSRGEVFASPTRVAAAGGS
jgi:hypothetical protein